MNTMTVSELIEKLKALPPDLPVYASPESCGCISYVEIEIAQEEDMFTGYASDGNTPLHERVIVLQARA